ncbi:primosomal replication protein [Orbaceae bacterium ESL0727]|nr:primosomal replication protein [Orbaceae bacterium ESL0727]
MTIIPLLTKLKQQIDALEQQATQINLTDIDEFYFDEHLFDKPSIVNNSDFYITKIRQTYQALSDNISQQNTDKINFLTETLLNQITALTRELSTHHLRIKEPVTLYESLPQKHARHLDYLRRLQEIKFTQELDADHIDHAKIAAIDNRIYRCEEAIKKIEIAMEKMQKLND